MKYFFVICFALLTLQVSAYPAPKTPQPYTYGLTYYDGLIGRWCTIAAVDDGKEEFFGVVVPRTEQLYLVTIAYDDVKDISDCELIFIRTHAEIKDNLRD